MASSRDALKKFTVQELEKYLSHHQLSPKGLKNDKITRIMTHISLSTSGSNKHPQSKSISQNALQEAETENGDESDEERKDVIVRTK